jgi:hypothetical protein
MIDYYLSVPTEDDMPTIPETAAVDVIGPWDGVPGWHFNVRSPEPIEWPEIVTQADPVSPWRVWA